MLQWTVEKTVQCLSGEDLDLSPSMNCAVSPKCENDQRSEDGGGGWAVRLSIATDSGQTKYDNRTLTHQPWWHLFQ